MREMTIEQTARHTRGQQKKTKQIYTIQCCIVLLYCCHGQNRREVYHLAKAHNILVLLVIVLCFI